MLLALACVAPERARYADALDADSPCFEVDLLDGLDPEAPGEVLDLFDCLNRFDHLDALVPARNAAEGPAASGSTGASELARLLPSPPSWDVAPEGGSDALADGLLDLLLESIGGAPATVYGPGTPPDPALGTISPTRNAVVSLADALRADATRTDFLADVVEDAETARWIRSFESVARSEDPLLDGKDSWIAHLGDVVGAARSPDNDRWPLATGDSVRDVVAVMVAGDAPALATVAPPLASLLSDGVVRGNLPYALVDLSVSGHLGPAGAELAWLASVDASGAPLEPGEDSALYRFVRLLDEANAPVSCEIDLILLQIEFFHVDNLAVEVLSILAGQDPDALAGGVSILGDLLGSELTLALLHGLVDGVDGACDGLTHEIIDDLAAVEAVSGPQADDLLAVLVVLLDVAQRGEIDHLVDIPGLAGPLLDTGTLSAVEELARDTAAGPLWLDLTAVLPVLLAPADHGLTAGDAPPVDLSDAVDLILWLVDVDPETGERGWMRLQPMLDPVLRDDGTWVAVGRAADLMQQPESRHAAALDLLPLWLDEDPDLAGLTDAAAALRDPGTRDPVLALMATPSLVDALLTDTVPPDRAETPLGWVGRLATDGTLDEVRAWLADELSSVADR